MTPKTVTFFNVLDPNSRLVKYTGHKISRFVTMTRNEIRALPAYQEGYAGFGAAVDRLRDLGWRIYPLDPKTDPLARWTDPMLPAALPCPDWADYWTCDEVAECLSYKRHLPESYTGDLYAKLWKLEALAGTPTPLGGDGSGNTVETPSERIGKYDDTLKSVWALLTLEEQTAIINAKAND